MDEQTPVEQGEKKPRRITDEDRAAAATSVEQGEALFQTGDAVGAAKQFLEAVERDPRSVRAWNDMGVALHGLGNLAEAEIAFRTALRHGPDDPDVLENLKMVTDPPKDTSPWPLATAAEIRILAWPDYGQPGELESLMRRFGKPLADNPAACLCLRHDPEVDGDAREAVEALREVHDRIVGTDSSLEVLLVDDPMTRDDWLRLGVAVHAVVVLASARNQPRLSFNETIQVPRIRSGADLEATLRAHGALPEEEVAAE